MQLKFYGIEHLSQLWLHFLALIFQNSNWLGKDDSLIPIILHSPLLTPVKNRIQSVSSFGVFLTDQSGESATELQTHWLRRVRGTCLQTELPFTERLVKLDDAFEASLKISDHKILLQDNVMTTDSTQNTTASCLKKADAIGVAVFLLGRRM